MKTAKIGIVTYTLLTYLDELDNAGISYNMTRKNTRTWELWIDGCEGCEVMMYPNGTWDATTHILVSNEEST